MPGAVAASGLPRDRALELAVEFGDDPDDPVREDPFDVPVWRPSTAQDPAWPSPWGWGRPGWHAECAAMAMAAFGASVDLLIGGRDLTFPHHAYQSAMVQAGTSVTPFARRAMHVGAVHYQGRRMAKSTGNLVLISDLLRSYPPAAIRLLLLDRPWQTEWEYHEGDLDAAAADLETLAHTPERRARCPADARSAANTPPRPDCHRWPPRESRCPLPRRTRLGSAHEREPPAVPCPLSQGMSPTSQSSPLR